MTKIKLKGLTKKYGNFTANNKIDMSIEPGEIRCIVGENGAGKSTLMNMLYGLIQPTEGEIYIDDKLTKIDNPKVAISRGIGMVHQHFKLVNSLTVYENIILGTEICQKSKLKKHIIDKKKEISEIENLIKKNKFDLNATDVIEDISLGSRQRVEILKMLWRNAEILILDEPTAVLTPNEVDELIVTLKDLKKQGKTIIIITHKLREVMELADKITVIKQGQVVGTVNKKDTNESELAQMMVGREVILTVKRKSSQKCNEDIYSIKNVTTYNEYKKAVVDDVSFSIKRGEIFGIAGVEGNGQSELVKIMTGMMRAAKGAIVFNGEEITNSWPKTLRKKGIGIIPEDRYAQGLCKTMSLSMNGIAGYKDRNNVAKFGILNNKKIDKIRDSYVEEFDIRVGDIEANVDSLSGGNAQKLIIARELSNNPILVIACQPTRGVDIGSIEFIHKQLLDFRDQGHTVILISSELSEILNLCDRAIIMNKGKIVGEINPDEINMSKIGLMMAGISEVESVEG